MAAHINPIKTLSYQIRQKVSYPKLDEDDRKELLAVVSELIEWLKEHQLKEQDFIRQAIVEGLEQFRFRLERFEWLGWGYTLGSLRDVVAAYR